MTTVQIPCIRIPEVPDPLAITLPGGITLEHIRLVDLIQPALAPLVPVFHIVDAIVAVLNVAKAIPGYSATRGAVLEPSARRRTPRR